MENGNKLNRKKLDPLRTGPYDIRRKISNTIYEIHTGRKKADTEFFHITKLIPISEVEEDTNEGE